MGSSNSSDATAMRIHPERVQAVSKRIEECSNYAKQGLGLESTAHLRKQLTGLGLTAAADVSCILKGGDTTAASTTTYDAMIARPWNFAAHCFPVAVVRPACDADVLACLSFVRQIREKQQNGGTKKTPLRISICAGGHSSHPMTEQEFQLDMGVKMKKCVLDSAAQTLTCEAGATLHDVGEALKPHPHLMLPVGTSSIPGICGLTLNGGTGHFTQRFGLTFEMLLWVDVALANGQIVRAAATGEHSDLFVTLRGSGACPGVVLRLCYQLQNLLGNVQQQQPQPQNQPLTIINSSVTELTPLQSTKEKFFKEWIVATKVLSAETSATLVLPGGAPVVVSMFVTCAPATLSTPAAIKNQLKQKSATHNDMKLIHLLSESSWGRPSTFEAQDFWAVTQKAFEDKQQPDHYVQTTIGLGDLSEAAIKVIVKYFHDDVAKGSAIILLPTKSQQRTALMTAAHSAVENLRKQQEEQQQQQGAADSPSSKEQQMQDRTLEFQRNLWKQDCYAYRESEFMAICFAPWNEMSDGLTGQKKAEAWLGRFVAELAAVQALVPATQSFNPVYDGKLGKKAAAQFDPLEEPDKIAMSQGAPNSFVRKRALEILNKYDPERVFVRAETFGYGGIGRVF